MSGEGVVCGLQVVRDQLRKMAVGGPQPANQTAFYEVSDSSEEETEAEGPAKPAKKINRYVLLQK